MSKWCVYVELNGDDAGVYLATAETADEAVALVRTHVENALVYGAGAVPDDDDPGAYDAEVTA